LKKSIRVLQTNILSIFEDKLNA